MKMSYSGKKKMEVAASATMTTHRFSMEEILNSSGSKCTKNNCNYIM